MMIQSHCGNQTAGGVDEGVPDLLETDIPVGHVALFVLAAGLPESLPRPQIIPGAVHRHHDPGPGLFHHGVIDGIGRACREGGLVQPEKVQIRLTLADGRSAGGHDLGGKQLDFIDPAAGLENKHAAVPAKFSRRQVGFSSLPIGLFNELVNFPSVLRFGFPACLNRTSLPDIAVTGFGSSGHNAERHQLAPVGKAGASSQGLDKSTDLANEVVGGQCQQEGVGLPTRRHQGRHGQGGGRVAPDGLEYDAPRRYPELP
jgi:hypothetical protein